MVKFTRTARLLAMICLTGLFFFAELIVGYAVGSMALIADSFHMLSDLLSLIIALYCIQVAKKKNWTRQYTYGWQRAEVLGALVNGVFLLALCFTIFVEAVERFFNPVEISDPVLVLWVGGAGLVVNLLGLLIFGDHHHHHHHHDSHGHAHSHDHSHAHTEEISHHSEKHKRQLSSVNSTVGTEETQVDIVNGIATSSMTESEPQKHSGSEKKQSQTKMHNMNMKGVFLHILGDALGSIGVIASALIIWLTTWEYRFYFDPIISLVIVFILLVTTIPLVKMTSRILLQGVPDSVRVEELCSDILKISNVIDVHELHIWQLSDTKLVASIHVVIPQLDSDVFMEVASRIKQVFHSHGIHSATIQPEYHSGRKSNKTSDNEEDDNEEQQVINYNDDDDDIIDRRRAEKRKGRDLVVEMGEYDEEIDCLLRCNEDNCSIEDECCPPGVIKEWKFSRGRRSNSPDDRGTTTVRSRTPIPRTATVKQKKQQKN